MPLFKWLGVEVCRNAFVLNVVVSVITKVGLGEIPIFRMNFSKLLEKGMRLTVLLKGNHYGPLTDSNWVNLE